MRAVVPEDLSLFLLVQLTRSFLHSDKDVHGEDEDPEDQESVGDHLITGGLPALANAAVAELLEGNEVSNTGEQEGDAVAAKGT